MNPPPTPFSDLPPMRKVKRVLVAVGGGTVLALGIVLLVLPGPGSLVIPAGLAILAVEFAWARRWLRRARDIVRGGRGSNDSGPSPTAGGVRT